MKTLKHMLLAILMMSCSMAQAAGYELKVNVLDSKYEGKMVHLNTGDDLLNYQRIDSALVKFDATEPPVTWRRKLVPQALPVLLKLTQEPLARVKEAFSM